MGTRKPLKDLIPDILKHWNEHQDYLQFNQKLYKVYEGQVKQDVVDSLRQEIISPSAFNRAIQRIPSINVIQKSVQKLSKVYAHEPKRLTDNAVDKEIMDNILKHSNLNDALNTSNSIYNLHKGCVIEPFIVDGMFKFRVLAYHQFLPYSDDVVDPTNMTVLVKLLGREKRVFYETKFDQEGNKLDTSDEQVRDVDILSLTSDKEFMIIDSSGDIRMDKMKEMGVTTTKNPFGTIPGCYLNASKFELVPYPNQAGYDISILIPKLLTDLNFAAQYMSHSIIWTKNANINSAELNPDAVVDLGDTEEGQGEPDIGVIDPKVDIEKILQLVEFELSSYFASVGIKTTTQGSMMPGREASGFAKAMDEGDASQERQLQVEMYKDVEKKLWDIISKMQNTMSNSVSLKERRKFTPTFTETLSVKFAEMKVLKSDKQKLEEIKMQQDQKLMSRRQALKVIHPDFTEVQLDNWEKELDDEKDKLLEEMLAFGPDESEVPKSNETRDEQESQRKEEMGE